MNSEITKFIEEVEFNKVPKRWMDSTDKIKNDYETLKSINETQTIYGVNKKVGHMDNTDIANANSFQEYLIKNHNLAINPPYTQEIVKYIKFSKIEQTSHGMSGISPSAYKTLINIYADNIFIPIPKSSSYSAGDVIPASALAVKVNKVLNENKLELGLKDGISLINGSFIQAGYSLSLIPKLRNSVNKFIDNTIKTFKVGNYDTTAINPKTYPNNKTLKSVSKFLKSKLENKKSSIQEPISIRSTPQVLGSIIDSLSSLENQIEIMLNNPSDNPLIIGNSAISNATFFSPNLTLEIDKMINSILFVSWIIERRLHHLLSGKVHNVSLNGSKNELGAIQVPKLATNILTNMRITNGTRAFSNGSSTSYGIEDNWSSSLIMAEKLNDLIAEMEKLMLIEDEIIQYIEDQDYEKFKNNIHFKNRSSKTVSHQFLEELFKFRETP